MIKDGIKKRRIQIYSDVYQQLADYYGSFAELHRESPTIAGDTVLDSLIATMLTQATTDRTAIRAFRALKQRFPRWEMLMESSDADVEKVIAVAGLAHQKAKHIRAVLEKVHTDFGDYSLEALRLLDSAKVHNTLLALPGVGPKTAACVRAFALGHAAFPVDTHVHRILQRLGWSNPKLSPTQVQTEMEKVIPPEIQSALHIYLIHHGRTICKARKPSCPECPINKDCQKQGV